MLLWSAFLLGSLSCIDLTLPPQRSGHLDGRVLVSPGVGLANAEIWIEQLDLYDGRATVNYQLGSARTDEQGYFPPIATGVSSGLLQIRALGGTYRDLVSGEAIQLDASTELRALYLLPILAQETLLVTPVHALVEAKFRSRLREVGDATRAISDAYRILDAHFGALKWERVVPADLSEPATSPTDEIRAAFLLGGLSILADDLRSASGSTPQAVNLFTLLNAAVKDLSEDPLLDGNDRNDASPGSGLQVGTCPPVDPSCASPPTGCQLGACRASCDVYANLWRGSLVGATRKFIGSREFPSDWNGTQLGAEDARALLESLGSNTDPELFGSACLETADRVPPSIVWETVEEAAFVRGTIAVRVRASDDAEAAPRVFFDAHLDTDGSPDNQVATAIIDTTSINGGADGAFTLTAIARDAAGNERRSTRTLQADNTPPTVSLQSSGFFVEGGVWWTAEAAPSLRGSAGDAHLQEVQISIGGEVVALGTVEGSTWTAPLPAGVVTADGNEVLIRAVDLAGNAAMTAPVQLRLDATPPGILVESSPVHDEALSTIDYELDQAPNNLWLQRHVVDGSPLELAQSTPGACTTIRKFSHLLYRQHVLGATGALNPLQLNWVVSDDGVGIAASTTQLRVTLKRGASVDELIPWTPVSGVVIAPQAIRYALGLYRDGALAVPALGTTEGEYHVELRAIDQLGRTTRQERCWTHRILAPQLRPSGPAAGQPAMFSVSLRPEPGKTEDVSARFLNTTATGDAMWIRRVKNYLGTPVYLHVAITQNVDAQVTRSFVIRNALTNRRGVSELCGRNPCNLTQATQVTVGPLEGRHDDLALRARLYRMNGSQLGAEIFPCAGCANDDATQRYTFELPARSTPHGAPLAEYAIVTHLRPTLPAGGGTDVLMAPRDSAHPDSGPYGEFTFNGIKLTGRADPPGAEACIEQEYDAENNRWYCIEKATRQTYRALTSLEYRMLAPLTTSYSAGATPLLLTGLEEKGILLIDSSWTANESSLP